MRNKKIIYMGAAFLVLLIILFISKSTDRTMEKTTYFIDIDTSKVDYLHFSSPDNGEITLELVDGIWRVTEPIDFPADQRNVHETLKKLSELEIENLVTSREDQQATYEVDDVKGVNIEVKSGGKPVASIVMGKTASTYRHTYFKKKGSNEIQMVNGSYKYYIDRKLKDWRNKIILEINKDAIEALKLTYPDKVISVTLEDTLWYADDGKDRFKATRKAVDPLINYLSRLRASDFYDISEENPEPDMSSLDCAIEITFDGGKTASLLLKKENEEGKMYFLKRSDSDIIYKVYQGTANVLMKNMEDFRDRGAEQLPTMPEKR